MILVFLILRAYKVLDTSGDRADMKVRAQKANVAAAAKVQTETLLKEPDKAADTLGHIPYFAQLRELAESLEAAGDDKAALKVMNDSVRVMKDRDILDSVITNTEARIKRRT